MQNEHKPVIEGTVKGNYLHLQEKAVITVIIKGGLVTEIQNIPPNTRVQVCDYDVVEDRGSLYQDNEGSYYYWSEYGAVEEQNHRDTSEEEVGDRDEKN